MILRVTSRGCDRTWENDALREGRLGEKDGESFERHRRACSACSTAFARDERLRALGRTLPPAEGPQLVLRRIRSRVLREVSNESVVERRLQRSWTIALAMLAASALFATFMLAHGVTSRSSSVPIPLPIPLPVAAVATAVPEPFAGSVSARPDTTWKQTRDQGIERVAVDQGTVRIHVRPQRPGERFLVVMPDGELEVRGTTFEVEVSKARTASVRVDEGNVELRLQGDTTRSLSAGATWTATATAGQEPSLESPGPASPRTPPRPRVQAASASDDGAAVYADGIRQFREGRYEVAAVSFRAFASSHARAPEAQDASFLEAVALDRAGRLDAAALAAERHLETYPRSFRAHDASLLIARAASRRADCERVRAVLAPWSRATGDDEVEALLRTCGSATSNDPAP